MNELRRNELVQKTNDFSSVSKHSMCAAGYMKDDFMQHFIAKKARRTPLINRGYFVRMHAVHSLVDAFLECAAAKEDTAGRRNIIVLGAGYDTLYFRLGISSIRVIEIDFLEVATNKARMIWNTPEMRSTLSGVTSELPAQYDGFAVTLFSENYAIIGMDMRSISKFVDVFAHLKLDSATPVMLISEVVLTYIPNFHVENILTLLGTLFPSAVFVNYEQIQPHDSFGRLMLQHFCNQGSPLQNTELYPTVDSHKSRPLNCGWQKSVAMSVLQYWNKRVTSAEKLRIGDLEPFDEYEEFYEKCRHYVISLAVNGDFSSVIENYSELSPSSTGNGNIMPFPCTLIASPFRVYGHAVGMITLQNLNGVKQIVVVLIGGVSPHSNMAASSSLEMSAVKVMDNLWTMWIPSQILNHEFARPLIHHGVCHFDFLQEELHVFGGRTSPGKANCLAYRLRFHCTYSSNSELRVAVSIHKEDTDRFDPNLAVGSMQRTNVASARLEETGQSFAVVCSSTLAHKETVLFGLRVFPSRCCYVPLLQRYDIQHPSVAAFGEAFVLSGGMQDNKVISTISTFHINKDLSAPDELVTVHDHGRLRFARFSHTSHIWKNLLILIGGVGDVDETLPDLTVYDLHRHIEWNFQLQSEENPVMMLFNHASVLLEDCRSIIVTGGGGNCFSFGTHFNAYFCVLSLDSLVQLCGSVPLCSL